MKNDNVNTLNAVPIKGQIMNNIGNGISSNIQNSNVNKNITNTSNMRNTSVGVPNNVNKQIINGTNKTLSNNMQSNTSKQGMVINSNVQNGVVNKQNIGNMNVGTANSMQGKTNVQNAGNSVNAKVNTTNNSINNSLKNNSNGASSASNVRMINSVSGDSKGMNIPSNMVNTKGLLPNNLNMNDTSSIRNGSNSNMIINANLSSKMSSSSNANLSNNMNNGANSNSNKSMSNSNSSSNMNINSNKSMNNSNNASNMNINSNANVNSNKIMNNADNRMRAKSIDFTKMPVVDAVNQIIITAVNVGASDIHFDPTDKGITVRLRIDGILNDYFFLPLNIKQNATTRIKIMAGMNITETRLPQDGGIRDQINGRDLDLRVSSLPTKRGEKIVIRILDYSMSMQGIEYLYFSETNYNKILKMLNNPNGIILVTGATGTGKSTTLYSFLQKLNVEGTNIITVEDPVEMDIAGINQVQVNSDIGLDFAAVLRSILRQDPNIIMIGEIRDSETAKIAVRASITGHLVLSTIHTNNSLNTIERLLDMDVERYLLASALTGIVSQQLARKLCDKCKVKRSVTTAEKSLFENVLGLDVTEVYEPNKNGCPNCNKGFKGRVALQEVLLINQDIRDAISAGMRKEQLRELVYNKDVITMLQDGLYKAMAGFTTVEEVLKLIEVEDEDFGVK